MAFFARDTLAATVLGLFTTSWLAFGLLLITAQPGAISTTEGVYLLGFAGPVASLALIAAAGKPLLALTLVLCATRALLFRPYELTRTPGLEHVGGYVIALATGDGPGPRRATRYAAPSHPAADTVLTSGPGFAREPRRVINPTSLSRSPPLHPGRPSRRLVCGGGQGCPSRTHSIP